MFIDIESSTADTNPTAGEFSGTNAGMLDTAIALSGIGPIQAADASTAAGVWSATGIVTPPFVGETPWLLEILGIGLSVDQVLPDFASISGGRFVAGNATGTLFDADVVGLALVPEPSTALLVALGVATLGVRRRAMRTRPRADAKTGA